MTAATHIEEMYCRDAVQTLRELLARAEAGKMRGLVFAYKAGPHRHRFGFAGEYASSPFEALGCLARMSWRANEHITGYSGAAQARESRTMPL